MMKKMLIMDKNIYEVKWISETTMLCGTHTSQTGELRSRIQCRFMLSWLVQGWSPARINLFKILQHSKLWFTKLWSRRLLYIFGIQSRNFLEAILTGFIIACYQFHCKEMWLSCNASFLAYPWSLFGNTSNEWDHDHRRINGTIYREHEHPLQGC